MVNETTSPADMSIPKLPTNDVVPSVRYCVSAVGRYPYTLPFDTVYAVAVTLRTLAMVIVDIVEVKNVAVISAAVTVCVYVHILTLSPPPEFMLDTVIAGLPDNPAAVPEVFWFHVGAVPALE